ncbi:hypothetical protein F750_6573 [Streptomyces sp. PAMC 26508]|nr:hypothetical protein F750_6573 [Streptomyces sp. PAMC 26508]
MIRHAVSRLRHLTEPQVTGRQNFYPTITPKRRRSDRGTIGRHPFALL